MLQVAKSVLSLFMLKKILIKKMSFSRQADKALPRVSVCPFSLLLPALLIGAPAMASANGSTLPLKLALMLDVVSDHIKLAQATAPASNFVLGEAGYQAALQLVRQGKIQQAADYFAIMRGAHGDDLRVLHDYIAVSAEAGRHALALAELPNIDRAKAPVYVMEALANSARASRQPALAVQLYDDVLARSPERAPSHQGKIYTLSDLGNHPAALASAKHALQQHAKNPLIWEAYGYALRKAGNAPQALEAYAQMRQLDPAGKTATQARINLLASIGAAHEALRLADASAGIMSSADQLNLRLDRAAAHIRWAEADEDTPNGRFRNTDIALQEIDATLSQLKPIDTPNGPLERRALSDKLVALVNRQRFEEATDLYTQAIHTGFVAPAYARMVVAEAFLGIKRPDLARPMFEQLIKEEPSTLKYRYGLFYALSDLEQHREAQRVVDDIAQREPLTLNRRFPEIEKENPGYVRARVLAMLVRAYADDLPEANRRADALVDSVPANQDVRVNRGNIYNWRGWPRRADEEFRWLLAMAPDNTEAKLGHITSLANINDWRQSDADLDEMVRVRPENRQVRSAQRRSAVHHLPEFILNGEAGDGNQAVNASKDRRWEARLYSQPINDVWRLYARSLHTRDVLADESSYSRHRAGVGVEYKARNWLVNTDVTRVTKNPNDAQSGAGIVLNLFNKINDLYSIRANAESADESLPVRAAVAGISAKRVGLGITVRDNEMHRASADIQRHRFTDGNVRDEWGANYAHVFETEYQNRYSLGIGLSGMRNTISGTPYFNPAKALSSDFSLTGEWLHWREEQKSLWHRLSLSVGSYDQDGFDNLASARINYEIDWNASDVMAFRFALGRSMHPYDGVQDFRNYANFSFNRRF